MRTEETNSKDLSEILHLCSTGASVLGADDFKSALKNVIASREMSIKNKDLFINYIFDCILEEWKEHRFNREDFFKSNQRGEIIVSRNTFVILMRTHVKLSFVEIAKYFGFTQRQRVTEILKKHEDLDKANKLDAKLIERYERLNIKVLTYIHNLKNHENGK